MMPDVNPDFVARAKAEGWYSEDLMERIAQEGHIHFDEVPEEVQRVFRTAHDIPPEWHVRMQAAFQEHVDSAISKTTKLPPRGLQGGRAEDLRAGLRAELQGRDRISRRFAAHAGPVHGQDGPGGIGLGERG